MTDEVRTGLHYFETAIWQVMPQVLPGAHDALARYYSQPDATRPVLTFGSWIGGDRDGNPNVITPDHHGDDTAASRPGCGSPPGRGAPAGALLSLSSRLALTSEAFRHALDQVAETPHVAYLRRRYPTETYRIQAALLADGLDEAAHDDVVARLQGSPARGTAHHPHQPGPLTPAAAHGWQLAAKRRRVHCGDAVAAFLTQAQVFGLHTARLDIRQYSDYHVAVLAELCRKLGLHDDFAALDRPGAPPSLTAQLEAAVPDLGQLSDLPQTSESLQLFPGFGAGG